jgi:3-methyladenine DNA glycosylase AlkD
LKKRPHSPPKVADYIASSLRQLYNPERAENHQQFFKNPISAYGIETAVLRRIARDWRKSLKKVWELNKAVQLCELLIQEKHIESKFIGIIILSGFKSQFQPDMIGFLERWLESYCDNWATGDTLTANLLSPIIDRHPEIIPRIVSWRTSPTLWVRRAAVVAFIPHAKKGKDLDVAYTLAESLFNDPEDLIHKAVGWLLREAGTLNKKRLKEFLLLHGPEIPRTTLRIAIEKFPEDQRKRLLEEIKK